MAAKQRHPKMRLCNLALPIAGILLNSCNRYSHRFLPSMRQPIIKILPALRLAAQRLIRKLPDKIVSCVHMACWGSGIKALPTRENHRSKNQYHIMPTKGQTITNPLSGDTYEFME